MICFWLNIPPDLGECSGNGPSEEDRLASLVDVCEGTEGGVVGPGWDGHGRSVAGTPPLGICRIPVSIGATCDVPL